MFKAHDRKADIHVVNYAKKKVPSDMFGDET